MNADQGKAVAWGRWTENTDYGTLVGGVFSNADLFANYVGMRFYEGLTREVRIGEMKRPPTLVVRNSLWELNLGGVAENVLLRPFISDHLNEALNPVAIHTWTSLFDPRDRPEAKLPKMASSVS